MSSYLQSVTSALPDGEASLEDHLRKCMWYAACDGEWKQSSVNMHFEINHECYHCQPGEYATSGSSTCKSCPDGRFSVDPRLFSGDASSCTLCDAGKCVVWTYIFVEYPRLSFNYKRTLVKCNQLAELSTSDLG
jgi:hypothetical protein